MALSYKNDQQSDDRLNPAESLHRQEQAGYDRELAGIADNYSRTADFGSEEAAIKRAEATKEREEQGGWSTNVSQSNKQSSRGASFKKQLKEKGPFGIILTILLGGGIGSFFFFTPSLAILDIKERFLDDLHDYKGASRTHSEKLLIGKLKTMQSGICTQKVSIRCKFNTLSKTEIENFKKAGFKIEPEQPDKIFGRTKPTAIIFPSTETDASGKPKPGVKITNPVQLRQHLKTPAGRSAVMRVSNPLVGDFGSHRALDVFRRLRTHKGEKIKPGTPQEMEKTVTEAASGLKASIPAEVPKKDASGREYVTGPNGEPIYTDTPAYQEHLKAQDVVSSIGEKMQPSAVGASAADGILKGISVTGSVDRACTILKLTRGVAGLAKVLRAMQLAQYAMLFLTVADQLKAGELTPEVASFVGGLLTSIAAVDQAKEIVNETSKIGSDGKPIPVANPNYGKSALDSAGYQVGGHNSAPKLGARENKFTVGGGLVGNMTSVIAYVESLVGGKKNVEKTCSIVQNGWVQVGGFIAGLLLGAGTGGASIAIGVGVSMAIGIAQPFLEALAADMIAGNVISGTARGVDVGNAIFAGSTVIMGGMALTHGMRPGSLQQFKPYLMATKSINNEYIAAERYDAQSKPFDVTERFSFMGSFARSITPTLTSSSGSFSSALLNVSSFIPTALRGLTQDAKATYLDFNEDRFRDDCNDDGYKELGITPDIFCNVRYYMSQRQLDLEPDEVARYMIDNKHVNEEGIPESEEFKEWMEFCPNRKDGFGETSESDPDDPAKARGELCVKTDEMYDYFGAYLSYSTKQSFADGETVPQAEDNTVVPDGEWTQPLKKGTYNISSRYGWREGGFHYGIDLAGSSGKDIVSACSGKVESVGRLGDASYSGAPTNIIVVDCGNNIRTQYMHYYTRTIASGITAGARVSAGQKLAKVGSQGDSTGPHLHFGIYRTANPRGNYINPETFMKKMEAPL